jgi:polar amino acid transport system substrate-binding protein
MSRLISRLAVIAGLAMSLAFHAFAQDQPQTINAAAAVVPPFVMQQGDKLTGFSVDLWNEIAARLNLTTNYQLAPDVEALADGLRSGKVDVVVTPVYYTTERDREFDFSYPILQAGLQVMVRDTGAGPSSTPLRDVLALLFSRSALMWLGVAALIIVIPAHIVWLLDRGNEEGVSPGKAYWPNILHALSFATTALVSQVQQLPHQWLARIIGLLWMFAGVVFIALYTAQLTATLTVEQIKGAINGPGDLPGKRVATIEHSIATGYLNSINADTKEFGTFEEMFQALLDRKVDAVLMASPPLRYFASHKGSGLVKLVGPEFRRGDIGFVFRLGDPLRRKAGSALLVLREDGTYDRLYEKWFGSETE